MTPKFDNLASLLMEGQQHRSGKEFRWDRAKWDLPEPWPTSTLHHINWIPCDMSPENIILLPRAMHEDIHNASGPAGWLPTAFEQAWNAQWFSRRILIDIRNGVYGPFPREPRTRGWDIGKIIKEPYGIPYDQTTHAGQLNVNDENEKQRKWAAINNYTKFDPFCQQDMLLLPPESQQTTMKAVGAHNKRKAAGKKAHGNRVKRMIREPEEFWANLPPKPPEE